MARASSPELPVELVDLWYKLIECFSDLFSRCSQSAVCHDAKIFRLFLFRLAWTSGGKPHMAASEHVEQERPGLLLIEFIYIHIHSYTIYSCNLLYTLVLRGQQAISWIYQACHLYCFQLSPLPLHALRSIMRIMFWRGRQYWRLMQCNLDTMQASKA